MRVSDLMTKQVATVYAGDPASAAARIMWDCDCGAVPVLDESDRLVAIVTDRDICMAALLQDRAPSTIPVSWAMSKELHFCAPDDSVSSAEQIMRARQIRRLPVLDADRRLVGLISVADILRGTERDKGRKRELIPDEVTATLADICAPRRSTEARAGA
jgi:CBS domain-containing protein